MPELSEDQKQLLLYAHSSAECRPPVVVIDRAFPELAETAWAECQKLLASDVLPNFTSTDNTDSVKTEGIFRHAAVGSGPSSRVDLRHRSDLHCWVTPQLCKEYQLSGLQMLIKGLIKMCVPLKTSLNLNSDYSVQLAYYPGNGSRYTRHLDSTKKERPSQSEQAEKGVTVTDLIKSFVVASPATSQEEQTTSHRKLTFIYYLNKHCDGGQLRLYHNSNDLRPMLNLMQGNYSGINYDNENSFTDIEPAIDRLIVFRSDIVEHEVMPCYSPRIAITLWSSAHTHQDSPVSGKTKSRENLQSIRSSEKLVHISSIEKTIGGSESFSYPPPLQTLSSSRNLSEKTIFVGIVSYRDSECPHTIRNIFQKAWNAHRVFVGVVYQVDEELDEDCILSLPLQETCLQCGKKSAGTVCDFTDNIRSLTMPWQQARGPCYARHLVSSLWNGEDYYFQLDSHMRLRANWDRYLVELLEELKHDADDQSKVVCKPVITAYPLAYTLPNNVPQDTRATVLIPDKFDSDGMLRQTGLFIEKIEGTEEVAGVNRIRSPLWAAGFSFSDSSVLIDVPYDRFLPYLFFGEEVSMAARLFTHGYVFYTPPEAVVYHLYSRSHRPVIQTDHSQAGREMISETATKTRYTWRKRSNIEVSTMKQRAQARVKAMLGMSPKEDLGMYGLGNERTLSDFEIYIGVNFSKQIVECSVIANDPQADGYRSKWSAFISQELPTGCRYEILQQNLMIPQHGGDIIKSIMDSLGMDH